MNHSLVICEHFIHECCLLFSFYKAILFDLIIFKFKFATKMWGNKLKFVSLHFLLLYFPNKILKKKYIFT